MVEGSTPSLVGNIYLGKVVRVLASQQSVFVDIGEQRTALLHLNDCHKLPTQGEKMLVQVIKDPMGDKGARLSTFVALMGFYLVYRPTQKTRICFSQKITDSKHKQHLIQQLAGRTAGQLIVRKNAEYANKTANHQYLDLMIELEQLTKLWQEILSQKQAAYDSKKPKILYQNPALSIDFIQKNAAMDTKIVVDDEAIFTILCRQFCFLNVHYSPTLYQDFGLQEVLKQALSKRVQLPSGGFLVIDEVEAMTVIDVNAGSALGKVSPLHTNLEATKAIAHALRLKNIGGVIIIDFIDVPKQAWQTIKSALNDALKDDCMHTKVHEFSALGLLEMTRERVKPSLAKSLAQSLPDDI